MPADVRVSDTELADVIRSVGKRIVTLGTTIVVLLGALVVIEFARAGYELGRDRALQDNRADQAQALSDRGSMTEVDR